MSAQLDQIMFQMEEAGRDFAVAQERAAEYARQEQRRFIIQLIVTSVIGVTGAVTLLLYLVGKI